jgi:hypothetical protein
MRINFNQLKHFQRLNTDSVRQVSIIRHRRTIILSRKDVGWSSTIRRGYTIGYKVVYEKRINLASSSYLVHNPGHYCSSSRNFALFYRPMGQELLHQAAFSYGRRLGYVKQVIIDSAVTGLPHFCRKISLPLQNAINCSLQSFRKKFACIILRLSSRGSA